MTLEGFRKVFTDAVRNGEIFAPTYIVDLRDQTLYWGEPASLRDMLWTEADPDYPHERHRALTETEVWRTRFFGP